MVKSEEAPGPLQVKVFDQKGRNFLEIVKKLTFVNYLWASIGNTSRAMDKDSSTA
jgi:hypothetical protein